MMDSDRIKDLVAISTVLGAGLYAVVRLGINNFYDDFGLTPEDVGWGFERTLTTFAPAFVAAVVLVLWGLLGIGQDPGANVLRNHPVLVTSIGFAVIFVASLVYFENKAGVVRDGRNPYNMPLFPINTPCIGLLDLRQGAETEEELDLTAKMLLLGRSTSSLYLYDSAASRTVELPTSSFGTVSIDC